MPMDGRVNEHAPPKPWADPQVAVGMPSSSGPVVDNDPDEMVESGEDLIPWEPPADIPELGPVKQAQPTENSDKRTRRCKGCSEPPRIKGGWCSSECRADNSIYPAWAVVIAAMADAGWHIRFNCRADMWEHRSPETADWEPLVNKAKTAARKKAASLDEWEPPITAGLWDDILDLLAYYAGLDPFREWLEELPDWDGTERIKTLLSRLWTLDPDPRNLRLASQSVLTLLVGAVSRCYGPGAPVQEVPVWISEEQGYGKSLTCACLLPAHLREGCFSDALQLDRIGSLTERDMVAGLLPTVIVEIGEMSCKKGDIQKMNAFITRSVDWLAKKWRETQAYPRRFVMIGTSDKPHAALPNDPAKGVRRWLPVKIVGPHGSLSIKESGGRCIEVIELEREQLWAEALHCWATAEIPTYSSWDDKIEAASDHMSASPLAELVAEKLDPDASYASLTAIYHKLHEGTTGAIPQSHVEALKDALAKHGWQLRSMRIDGKPRRRWRHSNAERSRVVTEIPLIASTTDSPSKGREREEENVERKESINSETCDYGDYATTRDYAATPATTAPGDTKTPKQGATSVTPEVPASSSESLPCEGSPSPGAPGGPFGCLF